MATVNARTFRDSVAAAIMPELGCVLSAADEDGAVTCTTHQSDVDEGLCFTALVIANDSLIPMMKSIRESAPEDELQDFRLSLDKNEG